MQTQAPSDFIKGDASTGDCLAAFGDHVPTREEFLDWCARHRAAHPIEMTPQVRAHLIQVLS